MFAVVTNLNARQFRNALDMYFGSEKVIFCLIHQLNSKFNELLLNCDFEEDKIHYEEQLKELETIVENAIDENAIDEDTIDENAMDENEENGEESDKSSQFSDDQIFGLNEFPDDDQPDEQNEDEKLNDDLQNETKKCEDEEDVEELIGRVGAEKEEEDDESDEEPDLGDDTVAYVKLFEEPAGILRTLNKQKINEMEPTVRVIKSLIKTYAYVSSKDELLDELNSITAAKNGHQFLTYFLMAYKNWNFLHKFLFYFKMVKEEAVQFFTKNPEIPFDLSEHDLEILDDLFDLLAALVRRMNMLSLGEDFSLGKTLNILKVSHFYSSIVDKRVH